jgi:hypothetical protein
MVVRVKIITFWDVKACNLVDGYQCFECGRWRYQNVPIYQTTPHHILEDHNLFQNSCTTPWRRMTEWMYRSIYSWPWHKLEVSDQLHTSPCCITPGERAHSTHWTKGWVSPRTGVDNVERRKILPLLGLELQPLHCPACSQSLQWVHYSNLYSFSHWSIKTNACLIWKCEGHYINVYILQL